MHERYSCARTCGRGASQSMHVAITRKPWYVGRAKNQEHKADKLAPSAWDSCVREWEMRRDEKGHVSGVTELRRRPCQRHTGGNEEFR